MIKGHNRSRREGASGMSLLSTLMVLVIMGFMGAIVWKSLSLGDSSGDSQLRSLLKEANAPGDATKLTGAPTPAGQAVGGAAAEADMGGPSAANPPSLMSTARTAACRGNVGVVETAIATKHTTDGTYPASIDELVAGHWLDAVPSTAGYRMTLEVVDGQPTGHLLVNGQPGLQGCDSPVSGGK
jgi:hypothetical protein